MSLSINEHTINNEILREEINKVTASIKQTRAYLRATDQQDNARLAHLHASYNENAKDLCFICEGIIKTVEYIKGLWLWDPTRSPHSRYSSKSPKLDRAIEILEQFEQNAIATFGAYNNTLEGDALAKHIAQIRKIFFLHGIPANELIKDFPTAYLENLVSYSWQSLRVGFIEAHQEIEAEKAALNEISDLYRLQRDPYLQSKESLETKIAQARTDRMSTSPENDREEDTLFLAITDALIDDPNPTKSLSTYVENRTQFAERQNAFLKQELAAMIVLNILKESPSRVKNFANAPISELLDKRNKHCENRAQDMMAMAESILKFYRNVSSKADPIAYAFIQQTLRQHGVNVARNT